MFFSKQHFHFAGIGGIGMKIFLDPIPDHSDHEHHVNKRRDQRKQDLEDEDVGKRDPSQDAFARENAFVLEDGLQDSE